ncbi:hypothetical protein Daudx_1698 [Candidatus Desulforudis audaxviator]|nr:hypothetical protein Daudx_1698 [Candidatus Desulforudis audaxviator]
MLQRPGEWVGEALDDAFRDIRGRAGRLFSRGHSGRRCGLAFRKRQLHPPVRQKLLRQKWADPLMMMNNPKVLPTCESTFGLVCLEL